MKELSKLYVELVVMQFPGNRKHPDMSFENYYRRVKGAVKEMFKDFNSDQEKAIKKWLHMKPKFESRRIDVLREIAKRFPEGTMRRKADDRALKEWYRLLVEALED